ncbi:MAG: hypothetical protein ACOCVK_02030 [bacterium]
MVIHEAAHRIDAEFFAVTTETFFEGPRLLCAEYFDSAGAALRG